MAVEWHCCKVVLLQGGPGVKWPWGEVALGPGPALARQLGFALVHCVQICTALPVDFALLLHWSVLLLGDIFSVSAPVGKGM